jgi:hypothetical protein
MQNFNLFTHEEKTGTQQPFKTTLFNQNVPGAKFANFVATESSKILEKVSPHLKSL